MADINGTVGLVLGVSLYPAYYETGPSVVGSRGTSELPGVGLLLGFDGGLQSVIVTVQPVVIPGSVGLELEFSGGLALSAVKPSGIPGTVGLIIGFSGGLVSGRKVIPAEIPGLNVVLLGFLSGLASNLIPAVKIPGVVGLLLGVQLKEEGEDFETWVLTGNAFNPSAYSGWIFKSYAHYRGQDYAAGAAGIYQLGGSDQDGNPIHPGVRIISNLGSNRIKRLHSLRLSDSGKQVIVRVAEMEADEEEDCVEGFFGLQGDRIVFDPNIQAREFIMDIQDFEELAHLELVSLTLLRK